MRGKKVTGGNKNYPKENHIIDTNKQPFPHSRTALCVTFRSGLSGDVIDIHAETTRDRRIRAARLSMAKAKMVAPDRISISAPVSRPAAC